MKRYVKSLLECVELMDKKDATKYISKRKTEINQNLCKIGLILCTSVKNKMQ